MSYFNRLSDIITCNLSRLLLDQKDPRGVLDRVVFEMEEGRAGADRCVKTALHEEEQLRLQVEEQQKQIQHWGNQARQHLTSGEEEQARLAILRKQELEALIAGVHREHEAAIATREHLVTTQKALYARIAEARRALAHLKAGGSVESISTMEEEENTEPTDTSAPSVEQELEAMRRELEQKS